MLYTALGSDQWLGPFEYKMGQGDREHHARWLIKGVELIEDGRIQPLEPTLMGGMDKVQDGLLAMAHGSVMGQRLVCVDFL